MEVEGQQLKKRKQFGEDSNWRSRNNNKPRTFFDPYRLPAGWLYCPPYGDKIGLIIPSKVPLSESFNKNIPPGESFTPKELIHMQRCLGREIGLVVDLTNTDRYYPESDWTRRGIRHVKIRCPGKDSVPDAASVDRFISEVVQFTSQESQASKYVVVHCTHGHNRTGYMIVHFLVRSQSVRVSEAIETFAQARPPGIYRQKYVEALYDFYFQARPEPFVCPQTPEWKRDSDQDNEVVAPSSGNLTRAGAVSDADFRGDRIPVAKVQMMREFCYLVLNSNVQVPVIQKFIFHDTASQFKIFKDVLYELESSCVYSWKICPSVASIDCERSSTYLPQVPDETNCIQFLNESCSCFALSKCYPVFFRWLICA